MEGKTPLFLWDIDENELGVFRISQVLEPAIEVNFIAFSKDESLNFAKDEEKMRVAGPILIPNKNIWRNELDGYMKFSEKAVENAMITFKKNNNMFSVNVEHSRIESPSFLLQDWIVEDPETDKAFTKFGYKLERGTWFGIMQITDKNYWEGFIKTGKVKGFSVEISSDSIIEKQIFNMNKKTEKLALEAELQDGTKIYFEGDLIVGTEIYMDAELTQLAPDGEHIVNDEMTIVTKDGKIEEVKMKESEEAPAESEESLEDEMETPSEIEYASKEEVLALMADMNVRLEKLEAQLNEASEVEEELRKEIKGLKSEKPGVKSVTKVKEFSNTPLTFSERLKKQYQELGKL